MTCLKTKFTKNGVAIKHDNKIGWVVLDQIRTINKQRIINGLGKLSKPEIKEV